MGFELARWDPLRQLISVQEDMNKLVDGLWAPKSSRASGGSRRLDADKSG